MNRFETIQDLARLPWFELGPDGELRADPAVHGAIDLHGHLAQGVLGFGRRKLRDATARIEQYLPDDRPLDLDCYANKNFAPDRLTVMKKDLTGRTMDRSPLKSTHTLPNLERRMANLGMRHTVILPIDLPFAPSNAALMLDVTRGCEKTICFGSVHPYLPGPEKRVAAQVAKGARGIKFHPAIQLVRPDDRRAMRIYRAAADHDIPVLFHCGPVDIELWISRQLSQVRHYEKAIAENPRTTFVLGHSGALQMEQAVELAVRYPNAWLEVSCQGVPAIRHILEKADPGRIMWGTDWPFYHQAMGLAKLLLATDDDVALREKVLFGNARRLLKV